MASRYETIAVTPDMARELIAHNENNRPVRQFHVNRYARDMQEGRWMRNGETISVIERADGTRWLRNGQHRMLAVMKSGVTQEFDFFIAPESEVNADRLYESFDQGLKRSFVDAWAAKKDAIQDWEIPPREIGNAVQAILVADALIPSGKEEYRYPGNREKIDIAFAHEDEVRWLADKRQEYRRNFREHMPLGAAAALLKCYRLAPEMADQFADRVIDGQGLRAGMASYALRQEFIRGIAPGTSHKPIPYWYQMVSRAWNHHIKNREVFWLKAGKHPVTPLSPSDEETVEAELLEDNLGRDREEMLAARRKAS